MTGMTYTTLKEDVRNYLERGMSASADPIVYEQIPRLITLAERRCALELKIQGFTIPVVTTLTNGVSVYDKPDRWRETISFWIGTGADGETRAPLLPRSYEFLRSYWPDATETGQPLFYADYDLNHWLLSPTPDAAYEAEIMYYQIPELLSDIVETNWLTDYVPQLILYATLLEAAPFLKNDERIATWQTYYDRTAAMVSGEDLKKILDRNAVRKGA